MSGVTPTTLHARRYSAVLTCPRPMHGGHVPKLTLKAPSLLVPSDFVGPTWKPEPLHSWQVWDRLRPLKITSAACSSDMGCAIDEGICSIVSFRGSPLSKVLSPKAGYQRTLLDCSPHSEEVLNLELCAPELVGNFFEVMVLGVRTLRRRWDVEVKKDACCLVVSTYPLACSLARAAVQFVEIEADYAVGSYGLVDPRALAHLAQCVRALEYLFTGVFD